PQDQEPARKALQAAVREQQQAADNAANADRKEALQHQTEAVAHLTEAQRGLSDSLDLLRDEDREYLLNAVHRRCAWLLESHQRRIQTSTRELVRTIGARPDKTTTREERQLVEGMAGEQESEVREADGLIIILRTSGAAPLREETVKKLREQ